MHSSCDAASIDAPAAAALPRGLVALFALACGLSVANVYYAQPLLDIVAADFGVPRAAVGGVVTATQVGCGLALLLLVPLGDRVERRRLMLLQLLALTVALVLVADARTPRMLLAGMLAVGLLGTAMTQGLIACAAAAAMPSERGRVVGAAQGGVFVGLLLARVVAGSIADVAGWRSVYLASAAAMLVLAIALWKRLPAQPRAAHPLPYPRLLASMFDLLRRDRVLQIRGVIAMLMFAAFNIFWSAMVFPLTAAPYGLSHTAVGAFGLVGAAGALAAMRAGAWADRGRAQWTSAGALLLLLAAWLPLSWLPSSLWALAVGILMLDLGGQAIHVTNQSLILRAHPDAHSRLVGAYMLFYAAGSGLGALLATATYASAGWAGVCALGAGVSALAMGFWALTLRAMPAMDARDASAHRAAETPAAPPAR